MKDLKDITPGSKIGLYLDKEPKRDLSYLKSLSEENTEYSNIPTIDDFGYTSFEVGFTMKEYLDTKEDITEEEKEEAVNVFNETLNEIFEKDTRETFIIKKVITGEVLPGIGVELSIDRYKFLDILEQRLIDKNIELKNKGIFEIIILIYINKESEIYEPY